MGPSAPGQTPGAGAGAARAGPEPAAGPLVLLPTSSRPAPPRTPPPQDYSPDKCASKFTAGQMARAAEQFATYRLS
jgi:hypothetical protein